jgi:hypothetical protein
MLRYFINSLAVRTATVLFVFVAALPYLLRRKRLSRGIGPAPANSAPCLPRLWPHLWMGYLIMVLSFVHASVAMQLKSRTNPVGIVAATTAFFLLLGEVVVGLTLKEDRTTTRRPLRRIHFWIMIAFAGALTIHLWLNGSNEADRAPAAARSTKRELKLILSFPRLSTGKCYPPQLLHKNGDFLYCPAQQTGRQ